MDEHKNEEKKKEQQRARYLRGMQKSVGYEEQKRRKGESKRRRSERGGGPRRRREFDEDEATFEKIRRGPGRQVGRAGAPGAEDLAGLPQAVVVAVHQGRVLLDSGETARVAGHLLVDPAFHLAVGDEVAITPTDGPPRIEARLARRTCLSRPDPGNPHRALVLAANVDVAVIVVAAKDPPPRPGLIDRLLLALEPGGVEAVVCVNKVDLLAEGEREAMHATMAPYEALGCSVFWCSAATAAGVAALRDRVAGTTCVFVGHSGVGKSSVLNAIDPDGARSTGDVRQHDGKGRHTTTASSLRALADGTRVIDTPGVRAFGLDALEPAQVRAGFPEFTAIAGGCRFADCTHVHEPGCAVREAVAARALPAARYESYLRILGG